MKRITQCRCIPELVKLGIELTSDSVCNERAMDGSYCSQPIGHDGDHIACAWCMRCGLSRWPSGRACVCLPYGSSRCEAYIDGWYCTRANGHTGGHVACCPSTHEHYLHVWGGMIPLGNPDVVVPEPPPSIITNVRVITCGPARACGEEEW